MNGKLWVVDAPHFYAGIIVAQDGVIINSAPILKWACNKQLGWFKRYCASKGWKLQEAWYQA